MSAIISQGYVCYRASGTVNIDGRLDEPAWQTVGWSKDFVDIEGNVKPRPRLRTRIKMLWDDDYFYVGAELAEPHVWATLTQHDAVIFQDNDFEVFIDPDGDSHDYYEFEINALNTGWDLLLKKPYKDGGPAQNEWEIPGLKTAIHVNGTLNNPNDKDTGWTVEIAFPWNALSKFAHQKTPPVEGEQWRVNFSRVEWLTDIVEGKYRKLPGKKKITGSGHRKESSTCIAPKNGVTFSSPVKKSAQSLLCPTRRRTPRTGCIRFIMHNEITWKKMADGQRPSAN